MVITYGRIDRLSTFVSMDEDKYPELISFTVGLGDLLRVPLNILEANMPAKYNLGIVICSINYHIFGINVNS